MADQDTPLTDAERAELEQLRAEKARRERAELEQLRAEAAGTVSAQVHQEASETPEPNPEAAAGPAYETAGAAPASEVPQAPAPQPADVTSRPEASSSEARTPQQRERSFGERMVLSEGEDEDGVPSMPPAQKIIIAIALVAFICGAVYVALSNAGALG